MGSGWGRHWHGHGRRLGQVLGDGDPDLGDLPDGSRDLLLLVPPWAGEIGVVHYEYVALEPARESYGFELKFLIRSDLFKEQFRQLSIDSGLVCSFQNKYGKHV